eukprot:TRINITY_DN4210_c1_g1_i1.p1 TRINITY_DN4210_c1_g1~~TRINITY_DN4210_c1_g1_i1.p1  ORF type:complete len:412 (+),score=143.24 TRINITY_DN4210_c1_g1_i1:101-1237(+)
MEGNTLVLTTDLAKEFGENASGKTVRICSANAALGASGAKLNLNIWMRLGATFDKSGLKGFEPPSCENVVFELNGTILKMKVDLAKKSDRQSNGSSILVATTSGNKKMGKTAAMVGLNVTYNPSKCDGIDPSKVLFEDVVNCEVKQDSEKPNLYTIEIDSKQLEGATKSGKSKTVATTQNAFVRFGKGRGYTYKMNLSTTQKKGGLHQVTERTEACPAARGLEFTHVGKKLVFYVDTDNDFGHTASGKNVIIAECKGSLDGSDFFCAMGVYKTVSKEDRLSVSSTAEKKPAASKKRAASGSAEAEPAKKKASTAPSSSAIKKAAEAYLADNDGDLRIGDAYRAICKEKGWAQSDGLRAKVKEALMEAYEDEDEDEDDE